MAGLCCASGFYPYGYTMPNQEGTIAHFPKQIAPSEYNKNELPTAPSARRRTALATPGVVWPSSNKQDQWNNINPAPTLPIIPTRLKIGTLPSANQTTDPIEIPWSKNGAVKVIAAVASGGVVEPQKSVVDIARSIVLTSIDPAQKDWWARRVNTLDQLEVISATRGLSSEETAMKERILKEISDESKKPATLAYNAAPYVAPTPAMTLDDFKLGMTTALMANRKAEQKVKPERLGILSPMGVLAKFSSRPGMSPFMSSALNAKTPKKEDTKQDMPSLDPLQIVFAPPSPKSAPRMIQNTELGPPSSDFAEVKLDPLANRYSLKALLGSLYGNKKVDETNIDTWKDALKWFDDHILEYVNSTKGKSHFPKYIMDVIDRSSPKSDIFVAYLTRTQDGNPSEFFIKKYVADGTLSKIAEASASGKFLLHPNYQVV